MEKYSWNKYRLDKLDCINFFGTKLYRVVYLSDIVINGEVVVKQGDKGGYIESYNNLSQDGTCRVVEASIVCGNAIVRDDAVVAGCSTVCDHAQILGDAIIEGNAMIKENASISGRAIINERVVVAGNASVGDDAILSDDVSITGYAKIGGHVKLCDHVIVEDLAEIKGNFKLCGISYLCHRAKLTGGTGKEVIKNVYLTLRNTVENLIATANNESLEKA